MRFVFSEMQHRWELRDDKGRIILILESLSKEDIEFWSRTAPALGRKR